MQRGPMSEPLKSIHVRICSEADAVLSALSDLDDKDKAEFARILLEEVLLGRVHTLTLTLRRYKGLGFNGIARDLPLGKGE